MARLHARFAVLVQVARGATLGSSHVGTSGLAALADPADAQVAQLASVRGGGGGRDVLAWSVAVLARYGRQHSELGLHVRVANLRDLRHRLLGQDDKRRAAPGY